MTQKQPGRDEKGRFLPGNTLAQKSGAYRYLKSGKLPQIRGIRRLKKELERIEEELKASVPNLDVKKSLLINQIIKTHGFCILFENYCKESGIIEPLRAKKKILSFQPGFSIYLSMLNLQRNAIRHLNLDENQTEKIMTAYELISKEEEEQKQKDK